MTRTVDESEIAVCVESRSGERRSARTWREIPHMMNSLRTVAGRGITVLVGSVAFTLVALGAEVTAVTHGTDGVQVIPDPTQVYASEHGVRATQLIEPLGEEDFCDITPAC